MSLTAKMIAVPGQAWHDLLASCDRGEALPSPLGHAAGLGGASVLATVLGASIASGATVVSVITHGFLAVAAYLGCAVLAVLVAPSLIHPSTSERSRVDRWASASILPMAGSGLLSVVPPTGLAYAWTVLGAVLSARSGWIGANVMLGMSGRARRRAVVISTALGAAPVFAGVTCRLLVS